MATIVWFPVRREGRRPENWRDEREEDLFIFLGSIARFQQEERRIDKRELVICIVIYSQSVVVLLYFGLVLLLCCRNEGERVNVCLDFLILFIIFNLIFLFFKNVAQNEGLKQGVVWAFLKKLKVNCWNSRLISRVDNTY